MCNVCFIISKSIHLSSSVFTISITRSKQIVVFFGTCKEDPFLLVHYGNLKLQLADIKQTLLSPKGTVNPAQYMGHTHETKQALHDARKSGANAEAANLFWEKIWKIGGRTIGVKAALNSPQEMMRLGITEQDIALFGK